MFSRQHVELASKFYQSHDAMKFLFGEKFGEKIAETREVVERVMEATNTDVIPAVQRCIETIVEKYPYDNGIHVAMLLATAVEMIEGSPNNGLVSGRRAAAQP